MRKLLVILLMMPLVLLANDDLEKAKSLYDQKHYKEALAMYSDMIDSSAQQPNLLCNIGNCHARLGNLGLSILYFERALLFEPNHERAKKNLIIQEELVNDDLGVRPVSSNLDRLARTPNSNFWNWMALSFSIIGGVCFVLGFKKRKSTYYILGFGMIVCCCITMYLSYMQYSSWENSKLGIVLQDTSLKQDKTTDVKESYLVSEGMKLEIVSSEEEWSQVRLNKETLWIPNAYFEKI